MKSAEEINVPGGSNRCEKHDRPKIIFVQCSECYNEGINSYASERVKEAGRNSGQDAKDHYLEGKLDGLEEAANTAWHCINDGLSADEVAKSVRALKDVK